MKKIDDILKGKSSIKKTAKVAAICHKSEKMINNYLKTGKVEVLKYQNETLFIKTEPGLSQTVFQNQEEIISKLKQELNISLDRISFRS